MKTYRLKWSSHSENLESVFVGLFESESLADVTVVCKADNEEGFESIKAHRILLSACSEYFMELFVSCPTKRPVVVLPDVNRFTMQAILNFVYTGEVNVLEEHINDLLDAAKALQIRGLSAKEEETRDDDEEVRSNIKTEDDDPIDIDGPKISKVETIVDDESFSQSFSPVTDDLQHSDDPVSSPPPKKKRRSIASIAASMQGSPLGVPDALRLPELLGRVTQQQPVTLSSEEVAAILAQVPTPTCPICGKDCANYPNLRSHLQTHNNAKPFACDFCDAKFSRASHLCRHRRTHTGEKPFQCRICNKFFSRQDKLKSHLDRHEPRGAFTKVQRGKPKMPPSPSLWGTGGMSGGIFAAAAAYGFPGGKAVDTPFEKEGFMRIGECSVRPLPQ